MSKKKKFYNFIFKDDIVDLYIYGEIGFWGDGVTAIDFKNELNEYKGKDLNIHIDSPGGNVFEGNTIGNLIKAHNGKKIAIIEGLCASIATQIALSCDEVKMYRNALFMIHRASCGVWGNSKELQKQIETLNIIDDVLAEIYCDKTGKSKEEMLALMDDETWFKAKDCVEIGFANAVVEEEAKLVACLDSELFKNYKNIPQNLLKSDDDDNNKFDEEIENTIKDLEIILALNKNS